MPDSGICRQSLNKYAIAVPSLFLSMSKKVRSLLIPTFLQHPSERNAPSAIDE